MLRIFINIKAIFIPDICFNCGERLGCVVITEMHDQGFVISESSKCGNCGNVVNYWDHGSYTDPWYYLDSRWKRFKYLFLGKL